MENSIVNLLLGSVLFLALIGPTSKSKSFSPVAIPLTVCVTALAIMGLERYHSTILIPYVALLLTILGLVFIATIAKLAAAFTARRNRQNVGRRPSQHNRDRIITRNNASPAKRRQNRE